MNGRSNDYEYTVSKENNAFFWKVGCKGDLTTIEESTGNKDELQNFMMAVSDNKLILSKLLISLTCFFIVAMVSFLLYKKGRKIFKGAVFVIVLASSVALYIAVDLSNALQDVKLQYLGLTN